MNVDYLRDVKMPPRETFERFPTWVQPIVTLISGIPGQGETPWFSISPIGAICIDVSKVVFGVGAAFWLTHDALSAIWMLPILWILTVNGARSLTSDAHYAGHACVTGQEPIDYWIGEAISTFVLSINMNEYAPGHNQVHHGRAGMSTLGDPDVQLVHILGYKPGKPKQWYMRKLLLSLISPRFHAWYTWARIKSNFVSALPKRLLLAWVRHGAVLLSIWYWGLWVEYVLAWIIPMLLLYGISAALQFPSEHLWLRNRGEGETRGDFLRSMSHGRFFLVPAPSSGLRFGAAIWAWFMWSIQMVPMLFGRFFVCVSILPAHDYHHRHARTMMWPMEHYLRAQDIENGAQGYKEYYGLMAPYRDQFEIWSKQDQWVTESVR